MTRNPVTFWIALSLGLWILGSAWRFANPTDEGGFLMYFLGWVSTLLAVGFYSSPGYSMYGKIAFAAVVVTVIGIVFKVLHWSGGNELIVVGNNPSRTKVWHQVKVQSQRAVKCIPINHSLLKETRSKIKMDAYFGGRSF